MSSMGQKQIKVSKLAKLTRADVRRILRMWQGGTSFGGILKVFPQISQPTLSAIMARRAYRAITDEFLQGIGSDALRRSDQQVAIASANAAIIAGVEADFDQQDKTLPTGS